MEGKKPHSFLAEGISGVGVPSDAKGILQFLQDPSNQLDDLCEAILLREGQKKNGSIHHFDESSVAASPSLQTSTNPSQKGASVATITAFSNENQSGRYANSSQETVATTSSTITATLKPASRLSHQSNAWFNAGGNSWMTNRVDFTSHMRNNPQNLARRESLNTNDLNSTSMTYGSTSNSMKCGEHNVDDNTVLSEHFLCENFAEGHSNASDPLTSSFNSNYSPLSPPSAFYLQHAHRGQVWTHPSTTSPAFVTVVHPPNHIQTGLGPAFFVHPGVPIGSVVVPSSSASYLPIHQSQIYQQPVSMTGATTAALPDDTFITAAPTSAVDESTARFQRWTRGEDQLLIHATKQEGGPPHNWNRIAAKYFPTTRTGPQCKTRWKKALKPGLKLGQWKSEEDLLIVELSARVQLDSDSSAAHWKSSRFNSSALSELFGSQQEEDSLDS